MARWWSNFWLSHCTEAYRRGGGLCATRLHLDTNDIQTTAGTIEYGSEIYSQLLSITSIGWEGGLLPPGHLSKIGTLLMPVKSIGLFKTLIFLPYIPESYGLFGHVRFLVLFYSNFLLSHLGLLSCKFTWNQTF